MMAASVSTITQERFIEMTDDESKAEVPCRIRGHWNLKHGRGLDGSLTKFINAHHPGVGLKKCHDCDIVGTTARCAQHAAQMNARKRVQRAKTAIAKGHTATSASNAPTTEYGRAANTIVDTHTAAVAHGGLMRAADFNKALRPRAVKMLCDDAVYEKKKELCRKFKLGRLWSLFDWTLRGYAERIVFWTDGNLAEIERVREYYVGGQYRTDARRVADPARQEAEMLVDSEAERSRASSAAVAASVAVPAAIDPFNPIVHTYPLEQLDEQTATFGIFGRRGLGKTVAARSLSSQFNRLRRSSLSFTMPRAVDSKERCVSDVPCRPRHGRAASDRRRKADAGDGGRRTADRGRRTSCRGRCVVVARNGYDDTKEAATPLGATGVDETDRSSTPPASEGVGTYSGTARRFKRTRNTYWWDPSEGGRRWRWGRPSLKGGGW